ncbi:uncharacterized protein V6R79_000678 [Siganus canaliculatus]
MESGRRICRIQLWQLFFLLYLSVLTDGSPLKVMSAPNLLRVGTPENIFVECQDCTDDTDIRVEIAVLNYPTKSERLASTYVTLTRAEDFQAFAQIKIPASYFSNDPSENQYVFLKAWFPDAELEKLVLLSIQSGNIYIQTDKNLYTPSSKVHYRIFAVTPSMEPVERDNTTDASITIDIVTPEGIIISQDQVSLRSGMYSGSYTLGEIASVGLWKIISRFYSRPQLNYSAEFEVKEYVLPSFEVKLTIESPFFYVDSAELNVNIEATFLFGEEVDGTAYGVFGVLHSGQKKSLPSSLQRVQITSGTGLVTLKKEHIMQTFPNIHQLVGSSIFVAVGVLTESGSEMVEAELRGIQIVTSPYTIHFKRTPKYFKPGMSFDVAVEVLNPDGTPAKGINVIVDPGQVRGLTSANGMARLSINTADNSQPMIVTVKTDEHGLTPERQAAANMTALPYSTNSNSYIHISVDTAEVTLGENLKVSLHLNRPDTTQNDITFLILSRGQLVKYGRYKTRGQVLVSMIVSITKRMLPSFRFIVYYHTPANEIVSDSVWVDAKDSCIGSLKLESATQSASYEPRKMFGLKITGDPGATVGLVAVDKGVYILNNKHRLNQKKVWDMVETYDTGCTPGGGKDGISVLYDAGLLFQSNSASGTPYRPDLKCPIHTRRKRTTDLKEVTASLASQYEDQLQRDCCLDGIRDIPVAYTCERRSEYIMDGAACVEAFLHCCKKIQSQQADKKKESLQLARSEEDDSYMDSNEIVSRTQFPDSWLWMEVKLPLCPERKPNCETTTLKKNIPLKDSITTWQFSGISLSSTHGICVAEPLEVVVRKEFFIDLRLPYVAVRGEQIEIIAVLYNYSPDPATVSVELTEEENVCSAAYKRGRYKQEIKVGRQTSRLVPFIIIPMKEGEHNIEVKAAVQNSYLNDGIRKVLLVVPEGVLVKYPQTIILDPARKGVEGKQIEVINSGVPVIDFVPYTPTSTQISVTGIRRENVLKNDINGKSMDSLIYQPSGCGDENVIHMTLSVIATTYLDKTKQWQPTEIERRTEALQHITTGYRNELVYRRKDGSFVVDTDQQSSTWLTAYVAKVFTMTSNLVAIESRMICDAVRFLVANAQQPNGMFTEVGTLSHREIMGGVSGTDSDASLTAFCVIALQESHSLCASAVDSVSGSVEKAVSYLEKRLPTLTNPYAVAITSYALANDNKLNQDILYKFASLDLTHWQVPSGRVYTLEATAYALLALVKANAFVEAAPVVRWFNKQRRVRGGYGSTQATLMVYQAIAEYWASANEPQFNLNVDILLPGRSKPEKFNLNSKNYFTPRTTKINDINQNVRVAATGAGEATVKLSTMVSLYYALPKENENDCQKFNLSVQLLPEKMDKNENIYKIKIQVLYKDPTRDATMSILNIGLLTGFTVNTNDLSLLSKGRARTITAFEVKTDLSERGSLVIYLDKVSHTQPEEIMFRIHQKLQVGVLQPASVSVYEHDSYLSSNETHCMKFYRPERTDGQLLRLCRNEECICAEENCSMQKKGKINNDERTAKACETEQNSKIDYVYKVRLEEFTDSLSTDIYTVQVQEVIKEGNDDVGPLGKTRTFLSFQHCRAALDLKKGHTYLIMGASRDISKDERSQTKLMSAPNVLRVGTAENIFVECQDCTGETTVNIAVLNYPRKATTLNSTSVLLTSANHFQGLGQVIIPTDSFNKNPNMKQYVYLRAEFPGAFLEKVVFVSFQAGFIFIQTDKTLYTPNSQVLYRAFALTPSMKPVEKGGSKAFVVIEIEIKEGAGVSPVTLEKRHILETFPNIHELVGNFIYVAVSVLTESGSEMVEAELSGIQIVTSPYKIEFTKTPKFFKPGLPFDILVEVKNPDLSPAKAVPVVLEQYNLQTLTKDNGIARFSINTQDTNQALTITAKAGRNSQGSMQASPYFSKNNNFIYIGVDAAEVKLGKNLKISITLNNEANAQGHVTYLILSKGQLVKFGHEERRQLISVQVPVTKELLPSFRFIAYYFTTDNEVESDSVWIDVEDSCMGSLTLEPGRKTASYQPKNMFHLKVTGDPEATVGLVAVDKGVYVLNNKHRLTQKKIWDLVEKYDTGCTPGGGKDGMNVFKDAGLMFASTSIGTPYREELNCPRIHSRKKRAKNIHDARTSLVSQYEDPKQHQCCLEGMKGTLLSYSCQRRSEYIIDGQACVEAFKRCCEAMENLQEDMRNDALLLARSEDDENYMDSDEIQSRSDFPESWEWIEIPLPACPEHEPNCQKTKTEKFPLKDSITTWEFTGISLSKNHGICVGKPLEVIVQKKFFIDLRLPYSAVHGEQIEIKAVIHNYLDIDEEYEEFITVRVELIEHKDVCSVASRRRKFTQEVRVGLKTTRVVSFVIIPMKIGTVEIEVKAVVRNEDARDGIKKKMLVVPAGILKREIKSITLDPSKHGVGGKEEQTMRAFIPIKGLVQKAPSWTYMYVKGREQLSALVENAISGTSMGTLIRQPSGCGEQTMIGMTLPVIATIYLDKTNQWDHVGIERRDEALQHIRTGYTNELNYRKGDGSFAVFTHEGGSTWLTAYVAKVFAMSSDLIAVKEEHVCEAISFLITKTQNNDGSFRDVGLIIHGEMIGDVRGKDPAASMTAFCLIAMQESFKICKTKVSNLKERMNQAVSYLESHLPGLSNPYAAAMASYALANANKFNRDILFKFASADRTHWPVRDTHLLTLEATAYALLALVKAEAFADAKPVVRWFNQQQIDGGGYGSTQATIMVYQAIAEYWVRANEANYNISVDIHFAGRSNPDKFSFQKENQFTTRTSKLNAINENVKVTAKGTGEATVDMVSMYYTFPEETEDNCQKFNLSVRLEPVQAKAEEKVYKLVIEYKYINEVQDATMTILDIGLLTGFRVNRDDVNSLADGPARVISKYETDKALSEKGSLILYLDKVSHTQTEEVAFRIHQELKAEFYQPAAVSIYEYYHHQQDKEKLCMKFYRPERPQGELQRLCKDSVCRCAEENCSKQKTQKISNVERNLKVCETEEDNSIDYVYKVRVENFTVGSFNDLYSMRIEEVIKEGACDVNPLGKLRTFLGYHHCRTALNLITGKTYLIMGLGKDIIPDKQKLSFEYLLGGKTWIEYWPSESECHTETFGPVCMGMKNMTEEHQTTVCRS